MTKKYTIAIIAVLCLVLAAAVAVIFHWMRDLSPQEIVAAEMRANMSDAAGVDLTSAFTIDFADSVVSTAVRRSLSVEPEIELGVHQGKERRQVLVVPAEPLAADTIYTFTLSHGAAALSWAFQTQAEVLVDSHAPEDRENGVNSRQICFTLNQLLYADLTRIQDYFSIYPQTEGRFSQEGRRLIFTADQDFAPGAVYQVSLKAGLPFSDTQSVLSHGVDFSFAAAAPASLWTLSGGHAYGTDSIPGFSLSFASPLPAAAAETETTPAGEGELILAAPIEVRIYSFEQQADYAALLKDIIARQPAWSQGFAALSGCDIFTASLLSSFTLQPAAGLSAYSFSLPAALPSGGYLLRVLCQGQSRDLPFAVSDLDVYALPQGDGALLWLHERASGLPVAGAVVREALSGGSTESDALGVARLSGLGQAAVCVIEADGQSLTLPLWQLAGPKEEEPELWRYLYLSQDNYENGDQLHFYGLVRPRDGSQLEYAAVSVYVFDSQGAVVLRDYADLTDHLFSGSIALPRLPAGDYALAIWQSGRELVRCPFSMEGSGPESAVATAAPDPAGGSGVRPSLDSEAYELGDSYAVTCDLGAGDYLCLNLQAHDISWSGGSLFAGRFEPHNMLNSYCAMLCYSNGSYSRSALAPLHRDYGGLGLDIHMEIMKDGQLLLSLTDAKGMALAGQQLALSLCNGPAPTASPLDRIYQDYSDSGLPDGQDPESLPPVYAYGGTCLWFRLVTTDENGQALVAPPASHRDGSSRLLVQAIVADENGVRAGASQLPLGGNASLAIAAPASQGAAEPETVGEAAAEAETAAGAEATQPSSSRQLSYQGSINAQGAVIAGAGEDSLLLVASPGQSRALLLLAQALCSGDQLSSRAAAGVLQAYSGDMMADLLQGFDYSLSRWQPQSPAQAALMALVQPSDVSPHALKQYLLSVLANAPVGEAYAAALAGLSALGQPLLNEARLLRQEPELSPQARAWLVVALALGGDGTAGEQLEWTEPESGEDWALLALAQACCGQEAQAVAGLRRAVVFALAGEEYLLYQTAIAQLLLSFDLESPASRLALSQRLSAEWTEQPRVYDLSYAVNNGEFSSTFARASKFQLPLSNFNEVLTIHDADGGGYCCFSASWLETEAAAVPVPAE